MIYSPVSSRKEIRGALQYENTSWYSFEASQQGIWAQVPQAGPEATPETYEEKTDWTFPDDFTMGLSRSGRKINRQQLISRKRHVRRPVGKRFDKKHTAAAI